MKTEQGLEPKYRRLLYRSQFVLGNAHVDIIPSAQWLSIRPNLLLSVHPDLNVQIATDKKKTLVLLGFILDPDSPERSDCDIIERLAHGFDRCGDLFALTIRFGGRWILIADDGDQTMLFHDPAGLRQVFYTDRQMSGALWCGSQPGIIADLLGLKVDDEAYDFISSPQIAANPEYWWPGDSSLYSEVRHLLPNHYLDLQTGACCRFWPDSELQPLPIDVAVKRCSAALIGLLESAAHRFELALPVTAGWDSRLLLAASKRVSSRISYLTLKIEAAKLTDEHPDIAVPKALLGRLGLQHDLLELPSKTDENFADIFNRNVTLPHAIWRRDAQAIFEFYGLAKVGVPGSVSEVARHFYLLPESSQKRLTGNDLSGLAGMVNHPFAVKHFDLWLRGLDEPYNLRRLDLFYLEQRAGNWLAMCQKEFDIAWAEIFTPYNCRRLICDMLSVAPKHRVAPSYSFYKAMITNLWPDVLAEPINPHKSKSRMQLLKRQARKQLSSLKRALLH